MESVPEEADVELKPYTSYQRAEELNPLNLTPTQKAQYVDYERQLKLMYPNLHKDFIKLAIDYYFVKGHEECEREVAEGKFDNNFVGQSIKKEEPV